VAVRDCRSTALVALGAAVKAGIFVVANLIDGDQLVRIEARPGAPQCGASMLVALPLGSGRAAPAPLAHDPDGT
jgi:hypothetical protein